MRVHRAGAWQLLMLVLRGPLRTTAAFPLDIIIPRLRKIRFCNANNGCLLPNKPG